MATNPIEQLKDYKKINKTRRSRGYSFEYSLVTIFNKKETWAARRLGGSSTGLPDLVITNNHRSVLYAVECKSGESNILYIARDQLERCKDITDNFLAIYQKRFMVLAFKFKSTAKRKLRYRFLLVTSPFVIREDIKGVSYNIAIDRLTFHKSDGSLATERLPIVSTPIESIEGFVNFL